MGDADIEKKLSITLREDVLRTYNVECRAIEMRCASDWEATAERMGRWTDFSSGYKTLGRAYMESTWWVFAQLHATCASATIPSPSRVSTEDVDTE